MKTNGREIYEYFLLPFKVNGPFVQTFCIENDLYMNAFNVYIYSNDALLFQNKENKILFGPPNRLKDTREQSRYVYTHKCLSIPAARDLDIH